jgi:Domain of unknown function (DUF4390)
MIGWRAAVVVAAVATSVGAPDLATTLEVNVIQAEGRVLTSVTAAANWTPEVRELLKTGAWPVTFTYEIELKRPSTLLWDSVVARTTWVATAKLDTLSNSYQATRQRDGNIVKVERKSQESEIREWLTIVEKVQLEPESPLRQNNEYYVKVRLYITPKKNVSILAILPGGSEDASGRYNFTYIR